MKYKLESTKAFGSKTSLRAAIKRFVPLIAEERGHIAVALVAMLVSSGATLVAPVIIGRAIDTYIRLKDTRGLLLSAMVLLAVYLVGIVGSYTQILTMGGVGRRVLYGLRNTLFTKLQDLPLAFFNENKAGDLISRVNNDTDKLNQFVSQALMQFVGSLFLMTGVAVFVLTLNIRMAIAALLPAIGVFVVTKVSSGWVKRKNLKSLQSLGGLSSEIQESLHNFKVIVAFNRTDYFQRKFNVANDANYGASVSAGFANNIFMPLYGFSNQLAQLLVVAYGIILINSGQLTVGLLIGFLLYVNSFYGPMRQLATVWSSFQLALAGMDRISEVLALESNMPVVSSGPPQSDSVLEFRNVCFQYPGGKEVLRDVNLALEKGKAYALVGPTGGGKTTTASLMARLYDPTEGSVFLDGRDIKSVPLAERARKVGYIPQEPFLFTGTVRENIVYGNDDYADYSTEQLAALLGKSNLGSLLARFPE
ncbi:MAG: ABC transporter ATP-binding protein, partial [Bryobacteraceae bacterium]